MLDRVPAAAVLCLLMAGGERMSPAPPAAEPEKVQVILRQADFLAVDRKGRPLTDLRRDEVRLFEEGRPQEIGLFLPAHETPACCQEAKPSEPRRPISPSAPPSAPAPAAGATRPAGRRWVVLLFDASNLSLPGRARGAEAAARLVEREMSSSDRVTLMVDEEELRVVTPFTTRKEQILTPLRSPGGMTRTARDLESRLEELRQSAESCQTAPRIVDCARQSVSSFVFESEREAGRSLDHLEALLRGLAAIPDRKILFYFSEGVIVDPGDIASAAVEHAIGQHGYDLSRMRSFLARDERSRLESIRRLAVEGRVGFYPVNTLPRRTDDLFSAERRQEYGPENLPQARTDPFEAASDQVRELHEDLARATGGVALFDRDPADRLADLLTASSGVYTVAWTPSETAPSRSRIRIVIDRPGARAVYLDRYDTGARDVAREMTGSLEVDEASYDPATRRVRAKLNVTGGAFSVAPGSEPPTSFISLFFEVRDASGHPTQDLYQTLALPAGGRDPAAPADLAYPFDLQVPPGIHQITVNLRDLNGPARGSFSRRFTILNAGS